MILILPNGTKIHDAYIRETFGDAFADSCKRANGAWPGSELQALLTSCGINASTNCTCHDRMQRMNAAGIEWCKANRATIIAWLKEAAAERGWGAKFDAAVELCKQPWWSPFDRYGSIVSEAIRRAEAASQEPYQAQAECTSP